MTHPFDMDAADARLLADPDERFQERLDREDRLADYTPAVEPPAIPAGMTVAGYRRGRA